VIREDITSKLKALIEEQAETTIASADQELDIDSFTMMLIITFVKEDLGVALDMNTLDFDAFKSLNTFADLVLKTEAAGVC
jgi:acyl carrier protein